ncbi:hypothetical protein CEXT_284561 [Caerostris extrusa]|uniref:Uncharacterized protein n=1 Tax=Caerostris extrusa TaxID=172846 RepID=A0AAV4TQY1_CAEEX|nr:hypothetical protein CEXT_284561 [Caerostris extrusa]
MTHGWLTRPKSTFPISPGVTDETVSGRVRWVQRRKQQGARSCSLATVRKSQRAAMTGAPNPHANEGGMGLAAKSSAEDYET